MRAAILAVLLAACADDGVTLDNANDRTTCDDGLYLSNDMPVTDCARACASVVGEVDVGTCLSRIGRLVFVEGVRGACLILHEPTRVDWVQCTE